MNYKSYEEELFQDVNLLNKASDPQKWLEEVKAELEADYSHAKQNLSVAQEIISSKCLWGIRPWGWSGGFSIPPDQSARNLIKHVERTTFELSAISST